MALRRIAGPFEYKDLYGDYRQVYVKFWCDELDGFLAYGSWKAELDGSGDTMYGMGILQLDGTFTPRRSLPYGYEYTFYYDMARRKVATYTSSAWVTDPEEFVFGADWFTLQPPYTPDAVEPLNFAGDGVHDVDWWSRMFLPDRMLLIGKEQESEFYYGPYINKIFSLPYGANGLVAPTPEHTIQTTKVFGSTDYETWRPNYGYTCAFIQSGRPERTVFMVRNHNGESKALEYDHVLKQVVGWVRRLGEQPDLVSPYIVGYSVKHKFWLVEDGGVDTSPSGALKRRISIFADEAVPANLSNPVALTPSRAGEVTRYRVRLSGADDEPCIGHRVNWTLTGLGTVLDPQTLTDDDGIAETRVAFLPRADGPWEGTTIQAEVIF